MAIKRPPDKGFPKYPRYSKKKWEDRPYEYNEPKWFDFKFDKHQVVHEENLKRIAAKYPDLKGWKELTMLNWGTDDPEVVNWYLKKHCECTEETRDKKNYRFWNSIAPSRQKLSEWVWVPVPIEHPKLVPIPVTPKTPNKISPPICPHLIRGKDQCKLYKKLDGSAQEDCKWPTESSSKKALTLESDKSIGETLLEFFGFGEKKKQRTTTQLAEVYGLYRQEYEISRGYRQTYKSSSGSLEVTKMNFLPEDPGLANERVTSLAFIKMSELQKKIEEIEESAGGGGLSKKPAGKHPKKEQWPSDTPIVNPAQLERIAVELKCMIDEGVLQRLIVRGFTDHNECGGDFTDCVALSKARANWVIDQLIFRFRLLLDKEPDAGSNPVLEKEHAERISMGFVPAIAVDCGSHYSKRNNPPELAKAKPHRKAILEVEMGEARKPKSAAVRPSVARALGWHLYEFEQHGQLKKVLYSVGTRNPGVAANDKAVSFMRDEALAYLDYIERLLIHQGVGQSGVDKISEMKLWVREEWEFSPAMLMSPLTNEYYAIKTVDNMKKHEIVVKPVDECVSGSSAGGECAPWIAAPSSATVPNHCRFPKTFTPVEFFSATLEEKVAEKPESISWGPLIVDFNTDAPGP